MSLRLFRLIKDVVWAERSRVDVYKFEAPFLTSKISNITFITNNLRVGFSVDLYKTLLSGYDGGYDQTVKNKASNYLMKPSTVQLFIDD